MGIMARFHLGKAYLEMRNLKLARKNLEIVINKNPLLYPKAYYNMANIMSQEKREGFSHFYLGQYYSKIKKYKNAKLHFNKALDILDDSELIKKTEKLLKQISKQEKSSKT